MAARTAGIDRNKEITSMSAYVLAPGSHLASVPTLSIIYTFCRKNRQHVCRHLGKTKGVSLNPSVNEYSGYSDFFQHVSSSLVI